MVHVWHRSGVNVPADGAPQQSENGATSDPDEVAPTPARRPTGVDRRTLDEVFGQVLPDTTSDERAERDDSGGRSGTGDDWYHENRPPHHDR
jgi:hypothetical protein